MLQLSGTQTKQITGGLRELADAIDSGKVKLNGFMLEVDPYHVGIGTLDGPLTIEGPYSCKLIIDFIRT